MMARRTGHRDAPALDGGKCARNLSCSRRLRHVDTSPRHTISSTAGTHHTFHDIWSRMDREYFPILMLVGFGDARDRFSVKFYMVAMLFIVFDIETVFLIPWGADYRQLSCGVPLSGGMCPAGHVSFFGLGEMLIFIAILAVGLAYVWKKGALQWD